MTGLKEAKRAALVVVAPILVFIVGLLVLGVFHSGNELLLYQDSMVSCYPKNTAHYWYRVSAIALLHGSICIGAFLVAFIVIKETSSWYTLMLSLVVSLAFTSCFYLDDKIYQLVKEMVYSEKHPLLECSAGERDIFRMMDFLGNVLIAMNSFSIFAVSGIFFAVATLIPQEEWDESEREIRGQKVVSNLSRLKWLLVSASAILVSGIFLIHAWTTWMIGFITNCNADEIAYELRSYVATLFFLMLAFGFLPAWIWLKMSSRKILEEYSGEEKESWIQEDEKAFPKGYFVAMVAPYFVPIFIEILKITFQP